MVLYKREYIVFFILSILLVFLEIRNLVGFIPIRINSFALFGVLGVVTVISLFVQNIKFNKVYLFFFFYLILNIFITNPPSIFNSWNRLLIFILLLLCVSPVIENPKIRYFRRCSLNLFLWANSIFSIVSFFCYFLGINYFKVVEGMEYIGGSTFGGLYSHSMLLGPMSGLSTCFLVWNLLTCKVFKYRILLAVSILFCASALLFSASRAATVSTIIGLIFLLFKQLPSIGKSLKAILICSGILFLTFPFWASFADGLINKNERDIEVGGEFGSRTAKYNTRINEFESSPIIGIGFSSIDPNTEDEFGTSGRIEPGSSWLGIMSMTGLIGLAFVVYFFYQALKASIRSNLPFSPLLFCLVIWFTVHMFFEGYIYAAGGPLCFIVWLVVGNATDLKYLIKN